MTHRGVALITVLVFCGICLCGGAFAQEAEETQAGGQDEMMAAYAKAGMPGEYHKHLEALEGTWDMAGKSWMAPGTEPMTWGGTSEKVLLMGGRFLKEEVVSEMMGEPFTGVGIFGYNNMAGKYQHIWYDSMTTGLTISEGSCDEKGKVLTFVGEYDDPMTGKPAKVKTVLTVMGEEKHIFEYFNFGPDGSEMKTMEIAYTRK
jgi:hypothetical protein